MPYSFLEVVTSTSPSPRKPETIAAINAEQSFMKARKRPTRDEVVDAVFTNDMLVEEILKRAIRSNLGFPENRDIFKGGGISTSGSTADIANLRLVCKSWNKVIYKLHRKRDRPLFHLSLDHDNTSELLAVETGECFEEREEETLLHIFLSRMLTWGLHSGPSSSSEPVAGTSAGTGEGDGGAEGKICTLPPFHLALTPSFFKIANAAVYQSLFGFLMEQAPQSMTRFTFNFHRNPFDYIPTNFPNFCFHKLTNVQLIIERMAWSFIPMIQKILESAPNLETLELTSSSCVVTHSMSHLSDTIDSIARSRPYSLRLPDSTKKVLLYGTSDSCSCFYKIPVDNLTQLETLALSASSCILRQIDDMFQYQASRLRHVHLIGFTSCVYLFNRNYQVTLVPMSNLETLTVTLPWEIRPGIWFQYSSHLPRLKELNVVHHEVDDTFERFLDLGKESVTVERCTMVPVKPHVYIELDGYRSTCQRIDHTKVGIVKEIHACFSNLKHLGIGVSENYLQSLEYVFENMRGLKSLALFVESNARFKTTVCWDALFTGLSDIACKAMLEYDIPGYWNTINLLDDKYPSIRDLKSLEALYLIETSYPSCRAFTFGEATGQGHNTHGSCDFEEVTLPPFGDHFFSELSFHFSFYKMKKLKTLACTSGFMPSEKIQTKWLQEKGKKIKNIRSPKPYHLLTAKFNLFDNAWYNN